VATRTETSAPQWSALLALHRATHATLHALSSELADLDLTAAEINVLANLAVRDGVTVSALGAAAGSRPSTLTSVLDRLDRRGHITRSVPAHDRRAVVVGLTRTGRAAGRAVREASELLERRALGGLSAADASGLRRGLEALAEVSS
jgi:MarR family transcriptional regulator, organic hydroperoxide resistance regulator